jgi:hypothetical protein
MVLLCSSHVEPKKPYSDIKSLNKSHDFKITVVPMTEKDIVQNVNFDETEIKNLNKYLMASNDKSK